MTVLSQDEMWRLVLLAREGDAAARNQVVEANLGLVRLYVFSRPKFNRCRDDVLQGGAMGLMRAIETWDPARGQFSTYAMWWVRQTVDRAYEDAAHLIRLPNYVRERRVGSSRCEADAERARRVESISQLDDRERHPAARPERLYDDRIEWVRDRLAELPPMERHVIERCYGLDDDAPTESMAILARERGWHRRTTSVLHRRAIKRLRELAAS